MVLNTYHWRHVCFAVNTSRPGRVQSGAKDKETVMRWISLTPTWAAMPLIAALASNSFAEPARAESANPDGARAVVAFWRAAGPALWFAKDDAFDNRFRDRFLAAHEMAARGELADWATSAEGALALVILLDQFPRNAFRGMARVYATDGHARLVADAAIEAGHDRAVENGLAKFFYLPFAHSEHPADQERSVMLTRRLGEPDLSHALGHRDIVRRFGRFPHRNPVLGRTMTREEQHYLENGGFKG
jgi:uncharacterized protein (DUF924 family)